MELSIKFFLCMAVCMIAKINFGDCRFCSISVKTARQVSFCPTKKSEAIQASERLRCDKLALIQNCTSPANFKYHCVMNVYENATLEVCAPEWYISGYCAEFNMEGGRIQPHFNMKCIGCPTRYKSSDAFHYEYCYKMIQKNQKEKNSLSKSSVVTMTNETSGDKSPSSKNRGWFTWTIAIAVPLLTGAVLICVIVIFRKRKSQDRLENTNQDEQGNPLLNRNAREMNTIEIEITEDEAEHERDNIETKLKTLLQDLGILFFKELDRLKTGTDISNDTCNLIETELRYDDENDKDEENNEKEVEEKCTLKQKDSKNEGNIGLTSKEPSQLPTDGSRYSLKSIPFRSDEVIESIDGYADLFSLLTNLFKNRWKSAEEVCSYMISFERKHKHYFKLFKMQEYDMKKTLSDDFDVSMKALKTNKENPTLREIYAASEMLNRTILLVQDIAGNKRAILISPIILGIPDKPDPIGIEVKFNSDEKPRFRCLSPAHSSIDSLSDDMLILNKGHDVCFDKRFQNSFKLLRGENYVSSYISERSDKSLTLFQIFGALIYGDGSYACKCSEVIKKCVKECQSVQDMKTVYSSFVDVHLYSSEKEKQEYDRCVDEREKEQILEKMKERALNNHLQQWKSITEGDLFALSSVFSLILYIKDSEKGDQACQIIRPICSEITQTFRGFFILKRNSKSQFELEYLDESSSRKCQCQMKPPVVRGMLTSAESVIREGIQNEISSSKKVCCKALADRKTHTHLYAVQKSEVNFIKRMFWKPMTKKEAVIDFPKRLSAEQRLIRNYLKENFRRVDLCSDGSLENSLSKEIYGFENYHFSEKLRKDLENTSEDFTLKIQKATDLVGVIIFICKISKNYCRWIKFEPKKIRTRSKCRYYITLLLQTGDVESDNRFYRIIPIDRDGCNCRLNPPVTATYLDEDKSEHDELIIPKNKRHNHLIQLINANHEKLLSDLFVDETRDCPKFQLASEGEEATLILTNTYMSERLIDPILNSSNSLCRCTSKDIFGTEEHFSLIENLIKQEMLSVDYNLHYDKSNEKEAEKVAVKLEDNVRARLCILATIFDCSIYVIRKYSDEQGQFSMWEEYKPYSRKFSASTQSREKCKGNFYFTFFHSSEDNFHRVVPVGKDKKEICNCLLDPPVALQKDISTTTTGKKLKTIKYKKIKKNDRHPFKITMPLDGFIEDEVRHVPLFSCEIEKGLLSSQNMAARMIDPVSDSSFSICRCLSKDVFGTEAHFEIVRDLLLHEVKLQRLKYDDLINEVKLITDVSDTDPLSLCISLISDGIQMPNLQLQAAADVFKCSIYIINIIDDNEKRFSVWKEFSPKVEKSNEISRETQSRNAYFMTFYSSFTGVFHRVVPKDDICNCTLGPPTTSTKEEIQSSDRNIFITDKSKIKLQAEQQLLKTKAILNDWLRCNTVFELLLISIIDEMESRRKGVNIATITGSSIGVVGALLTGIGILGAPVTAGISLGLAIAGGVISTAGAVTSIGAKITEIGLSRKNYKTISRYKLQMNIFSNQLQDNLEKLLKISELIRQDSDHSQRKEQELLKAAPCIRALVGAGSIPLVVLRALSRAVVQAEAVFIPLSLIIDIALGIIAIKNLKQGSVTPESLKLRSSKHQLRLTRQQMFAWAFGNSEELEEKEEADFQDTK